MLEIIQYILIVVSLYSILRLSVYAVASNIQSMKQLQHTHASASDYYRPTISVIVPAHNEALAIRRTLESIAGSNYPKSRLEVIVANDGSTDDTARIVRSYAVRNRKRMKVRLVSRPNRGKAEALNYAIKKRATGQLIMCLDADSMLDVDCIKNSVLYFRDKNVMATASNVNIVENGTLLGLIQRYEYIYSHHFKRAHTLLNMEYIIGGVGSTFRKSVLKDVSFYESNTMTEDIDLTLKIVSQGNIKNRVIFAPDAITFTEPVLSYHGLLRQRFRWKYGRLQSFYKNRQLFFAHDKKYTKQLTWFLLPSTLAYEVSMLLEPFVLFYLLYLCFSMGGVGALVPAILVFTLLLVMNIWASDHVTMRDKIRLSICSPAMYLLLYSLTVIEYVAVLQSLYKIREIPTSLKRAKTTWISPERSQSVTL